MSSIHYALKSITRSWMRNLLLGVIVMIVTVSSLIALTVQQSAEDIVNYQKENFEITASLVVDRNALRTAAGAANTNMRTLLAQVPALSLEMIQFYGESNYVQSLVYDSYYELNTSELLPFSDEAVSEATDEAKGTSGTDNAAVRGAFKVLGYTTAESISQFTSGNYTMVEGSVYDLFTIENSFLVSDELALVNELSVGDTRLIEGLTLTVAGIYREEGAIESAATWNSSSANQLLMSFESAQTLETLIEPLNKTLNSTFVLGSIDMIEPFREELLEKELYPLYTLKTNAQTFEQTMIPFNNLIEFAGVMLLVIVIVGGMILLTVNMINVRERKYEIGVLRAIGMKKTHVARLFLAEMIIVTSIAMAIGAGVGATSTESVGNYMLNNQIEQAKAEAQVLESNMGTSSTGSGANRNNSANAVAVDYITQMRTPIDQWIMLQMTFIGLFIVLIGSSLSLMSISRYEPLRILASRS